MENIELNAPKRVSFHTLGCRLNFSESGTIAADFEARGYSIVDFGTESDVTFINTCTVTDKADSTCRNLIRKAHRSSPEGKVIVAGCYAQMEAEAISKMEGVDLILGTSEKYRVLDFLDEAQEQLIRVDQTNEFWEASTTLADKHTRAFLKIQDGCNYVCSFCIIPFARGRSKALPIKDVVRQARELVKNGYKEIVLTGVNIGEYEAKSGEKLSNLAQELINLEGLERLRFSSVEPNTFDQKLISVMKSSSKCLDHFHLPLQSGCDKTLEKMRRKYDSSFYEQLVSKLKSDYPDAGVGADIIVGHPGESDEDFNETVKFLERVPITHFHVFPYSKRKNTTAAKEEDHIQHHIKKSRVQAIVELGEKKLLQFSNDQLGKEASVLFERQDDEGLWEGYTSNFIRVKVSSNLDLKNSIKRVLLKTIESSQVFAEVL